MSWADVESFLARTHRLQPSNSAGLLALLETFVAANEDPSRSPNFRNQVNFGENGVKSVVVNVMRKMAENVVVKIEKKPMPSGKIRWEKSWW
jgi:hypothetical protein